MNPESSNLALAASLELIAHLKGIIQQQQETISLLSHTIDKQCSKIDEQREHLARVTQQHNTPNSINRLQ